jgi:hypothetical protein
MASLIFRLLALQLILVATVFGLFGSNKVDQGVKYQLQQKVLTLGTSYTILDDKNKPVYKVNFYFILQEIYIKDL